MNLELILEQVKDFFNQGLNASNQGDWEQAIENWQQALNLLQNPVCLNIAKLDLNRAETAMNLAIALQKKGNIDTAFEYYQEALDNYQGDYCHNRPELDPNKARTLMNLAVAFNQKGNVDEAINYSQRALEIFQGHFCSNYPKFDLEIAKTTMNLANTFQKKGLIEKSIIYYQKVLEIYKNDYCLNSPEVDPDKAQAMMNLANALQRKGQIEQSINYYEKSLKLYKGNYCSNHPELDPHRIRTMMNLAVALKKKGAFDQAINYYQTVFKIFQGSYCLERPELDPDRASIFINLANLFQKQGSLEQAINYYKKTIDIYNGNYCLNKIEFDPNRAGTAMNLANTLQKKGEFKQAMDYYQQALHLYQGDYCLDRSELDPDRASIFINLANLFQKQGNLEQAINYYQKALYLYQENYCLNHLELDPNRAITAMNLADALRQKGDFTQALNYCQQALKLLQGDFCLSHFELDPNRATVLSNLAIIYRQKGNINQSIDYYHQALKYYQSNYCLHRPELNSSKAAVTMNLAGAFHEKGDFKQSIATYQKAQNLYESPTVGQWLPLNGERCKFYANYSNLLHKMPNPLSWAKDKSQCLIQLLELAPEAGTAGANETLWQSMREAFARFHQNWFHYLIKQQQLQDIPLVLFAIQGREVASEMLDLDDQQAPKDIQAYQQLRRQLREIIIEEKSQAQYQAIYQEMLSARKKAALLEGYELLSDTSQFFDLQKIQQNPLFQSDQVLLLAITMGEQAGFCLIYKDKDPVWIKIPALLELSEKMQQFESSYHYYQSLSHRAYRRNLSDLIKEKPSNLLAQPDFDNFWFNLYQQLETEVWLPLKSHLKEINQLYILPQGDLFQIPFNLAAPDDLTLSYYPGLIYYGLKQGLIPHKKPNFKTQNIGLLSYSPADEKNALPELSKEITAIQALYQMQNITAQTLTCPPYPNQTLALNLLHFSGHGGQDKQRPYSTALLVGEEQYLGEQEVVAGKTLVQHAFINACVVGRIREDSQGTPSSFVTGLFRQKTESITTPIYHIKDDLAMHLGTAWHHAWSQTSQKNPLTTLKQALIQFQINVLIINKFYNEGEFTEEMINELVLTYLLSEPQQSKIKQLVNSDKDEQDMINDIINYLTGLGCFNANYNKQVSADMGVILYCFRVYGE